jgi:HK97 family phage major capsid protein
MALPTAEEIVKDLGKLKADMEAGTASRKQMQAGIDGVKKLLREQTEQKAQIARNRPVSNDDRLLSRYLPLDEAEVDEARKCFHIDKNAGAMQMRAPRNKDAKTFTFGLLDDPNPVCDWQREAQRLVTQRSIVRAALSTRPGVPGPSPASDRAIRRHFRSAPDLVAKIFNDAAGEGAEWIDDQLLPDLERRLELDRRLESIFQVQPVGNVGSLKIPFQTAGLRPYKAGPATVNDPPQYTASSVGTDARTFTPVKIAVRTVIDEDASEDSLIAVMPWLQSEVSRAMTNGKEDAIINGDTAATHQDTIANWNTRSLWGSAGLGGSGDHRKLWIGLRARAFDVSNATDQSAVQTAAGVRKAMALLESPQFLTDTAIVTSPEYLISVMFGFPQVETLEKFGNLATVLSGQLGTLYGYPIILSEFMTADLNGSGIYDNVTKNRTGMLVFNRTRFKMFTKRGASVRLQNDITRGITNIVGSERTLFATIDDATTKNVHFSYDLDYSAAPTGHVQDRGRVLHAAHRPHGERHQLHHLQRRQRGRGGRRQRHQLRQPGGRHPYHADLRGYRRRCCPGDRAGRDAGLQEGRSGRGARARWPLDRVSGSPPDALMATIRNDGEHYSASGRGKELQDWPRGETREVSDEQAKHLLTKSCFTVVAVPAKHKRRSRKKAV